MSLERSDGGRVRGARSHARWWVPATMILGSLAAPAIAQCTEEQKLTASDGAADDQFGLSVSVSGDVAVVGARFDDCAAGDDCGSAYVYRFNGSDWIEEQKLAASDAGSGEEFGDSVSASGDMLVVGAYRDGENGERAGAAYVFRWDGSSWVQEQELTASDAAPFDEFGIPVSADGDVILVGARGDDWPAGFSCGSAYVFRYNGSSWVQEAKLTASDAGDGDRLGWSVSASGDVVVAGARMDNCLSGNSCGSAYVFRFNGSDWVEEQKVTASDAASLDEFGHSVAVSGDVVVAGAWGDNCSVFEINCGAAYVFRFNGSSWIQEQKLTASDADSTDYFGFAVSVSGDTVVAGAHQDECAAGIECGSAYMFLFDGSAWFEKQKLTASDGEGIDQFGWSVSVSGDTVVAGARLDDCPGGFGCGSAYVFRCQPPDIPAASTWGQVMLLLLVLVAGTVVFRRTVSRSYPASGRYHRRIRRAVSCRRTVRHACVHPSPAPERAGRACASRHPPRWRLGLGCTGRKVP